MNSLEHQAINAYFKEISDLIEKINAIENGLSARLYNQLAMPPLYAQIERIAFSRYSTVELSSGARFKQLLRDYSNQKDDLDKIDIVFLYQWDKSAQNESKKYIKAIKEIYLEIKSALVKIIGSEKDIQIHMEKSSRFRNKNSLLQDLRSYLSNPDSLTEAKLELFDKCTVIYLYGRCTTVHTGDSNEMGFITKAYLLSLLTEIITKLKNECLKKNMLPSQLVGANQE